LIAVLQAKQVVLHFPDSFVTITRDNRRMQITLTLFELSNIPLCVTFPAALNFVCIPSHIPEVSLSKTATTFPKNLVWCLVLHLKHLTLYLIMSVHPRYIVKDPSAPDTVASSVPVLRANDNARFLASKIPHILTRDVKSSKTTTPLASVILPTAAIPISRILNHPNIVSLVDIIHTSALPGNISRAGQHGDLTVWEDMNAGSLALLLPGAETLPTFDNEQGWRILAAQNFQRFSLPESLCWHVLRSISNALLWLHHGVKETPGIPGEREKHDNDWHPILIMDVSPGQIFFQKPKGEEYYGPCKLGGFQYARVTGSAGGQIASAAIIEDAPLIKQYYWAPVSSLGVLHLLNSN